ncbi:MAG: 1-acyl-sn-glycerol-3-phosphate acyltransferase [candidate division BRC1 bacterium ADurb.BinA364]|nr:MAG: 1-acyl-sn-glycerol-3-phosphate acyltransferase [candidate division BRC1 bacterium ADurb.BinA364]
MAPEYPGAPDPPPAPPARRARFRLARDTHWFIFFVRRFFWAYFRLFHGMRVEGQRHMPLTGPCILAPNHLSYLDPPLAAIACPRPLAIMARASLFKVPLIGMAIRNLKAYPVDTRAAADAAAYKATLKALQDGEGVMIFPEGTRQLGRQIAPFGSGPARLAMRIGAPVIPCAITGTYEAYPRWRALPRPGWRFTVKFFPAVHPPVERPKGGIAMREAMDEINERIRKPIERRYKAYLRLLRRKGIEPPPPPPGYIETIERKRGKRLNFAEQANSEAPEE